jgi:hypothetical protein
MRVHEIFLRVYKQKYGKMSVSMDSFSCPNVKRIFARSMSEKL